jgi:hypothetical protein
LAGIERIAKGSNDMNIEFKFEIGDRVRLIGTDPYAAGVVFSRETEQNRDNTIIRYVIISERGDYGQRAIECDLEKFLEKTT